MVDGAVGEDVDIEDACKRLEGLKVEVESQQPPVYQEQGQPRGRKPKRGSKLEKIKDVKKKTVKTGSKNKRTSKNSKKGAKKNKKNKRGTEEVKNPNAGIEMREEFQTTPKAKSRSRKQQEATGGSAANTRKKSRRSKASEVPVAPVPDVPKEPLAEVPLAPVAPQVPLVPEDPNRIEPDVEIPDDAVEAPNDVKPNSIYSNAYRRAKASGGSNDDARNVAY